MSRPDLDALLEQGYGLRVDDLTRGRLERAVREQAQRDTADPDSTAERIVADPGRQRELIDRVTLQETAFFRDGLVWADLAERVLPAAIRAAGGRELQVWSAGCANGQEAWSLAMLLKELGAPRFEVVASDLSGAATARAEAGRYEERELRGLSGRRRERWLVPAGSAWEVAPALRGHVRVEHHNAATDPAPVAEGSCTLVLCRYVLIYLTRDASDGLLERCSVALAPGGRLVIGAAESLWHLSSRFTVDPLPHSVVYRLHGTGAGREALARGPQQRLPAASPAHAVAEPRRGAPVTLHGDTGERTATSPGTPDSAALTREGELAAARGELREAVAAFRGAAYLAPDDAVAHVRLGLALEGLGDPGAPRAYRAARAALDRRPEGDLEQELGGYGAESLLRLLAAKLEESG